MHITPAMRLMLMAAVCGRCPVEGKHFVGKRKTNMAALQRAGLLKGLKITPLGVDALETTSVNRKTPVRTEQVLNGDLRTAAQK
jgi:hypothetical protein